MPNTMRLLNTIGYHLGLTSDQKSDSPHCNKFKLLQHLLPLVSYYPSHITFGWSDAERKRHPPSSTSDSSAPRLSIQSSNSDVRVYTSGRSSLQLPNDVMPTRKEGLSPTINGPPESPGRQHEIWCIALHQMVVVEIVYCNCFVYFVKVAIKDNGAVD